MNSNNQISRIAKQIVGTALLLAVSLELRAGDGTWTSTASGNWSDTTKWSGGTVADGTGSTAFFNAVDLTADITVTLDSARTNSNLVFADTDPSTPANWILSGSFLALAGTSPTITVTNLGTNKVTINSVLVGTNGIAPNGLTVKGNSRLDLTGVNVFTNLLLDHATLGVNVAQSPGANVTNNVITLTNGAAILVTANTTWNETLNVKGSNAFLRLPGVAAGGNWNGIFTGDGTLYVNLAGVQMTYGGGNTWNSNLFSGFTGTIMLDGGGNFRFDINTLATTFGSKFAIWDLGQTNNSLNERGASGIPQHTTYLGALKGGPLTAISGNGTGGLTNTFQIGDLNLDTTFSGRINNGTPTALIKSGNGTLTLAGTNGYTGATTIQGGRLALAATTGRIDNSSVIKVVSPGTFDVSAYGLWTNGAGQLLFQGNGAITGAVALTGCMVSPGLAVNDTATFTFASGLILSNAATRFDTVAPSAVDKIFVNGDLTLLNTNIVQLVPSSTNVIVTNGTYVLFEWTGNLSGDVTNLVLSMPTQLGSVVLATNNSKQIVLTVSGAQLIDLTWRGDQGADWSTALNWRDTNGNATTWADGRVAHFDDTATTKAVTISGSVTPARVLISNTAPYSFTGVGGIVGSGVLVKDGTGSLSVGVANTYTGSSTILNGTVQIGTGSTTGSLGTGPLTDNGTVAFNRSDAVTYAASIDGTGNLMQAGAGTLTLTGNNTYAGSTVVSNGSTLFISDGTVNGSVAGTISVSNAATLHYYFNNSGNQILNNNLTGTGNVIYDINNTGTAKSSRTIQMGNTATNTGFTGTAEIKPGVRVEVPTAFGLPGNNITVDYDSSTPLSGSIYVHGGSITNTAAISIIGRGPASPVDTPVGFGALRLNNGWAGPITITGVDATYGVTTIGASSGTGTILGNISAGGNNYELEYFGGTVQVGPTSGVNQYGVTRITEALSNPNISGPTTVVALNTNAFSTNTLNMNGQAILRLNGNNIAFNNLIDESANSAQSNFPPVIQNGSSTAPATLTVGRDNNTQAFYGIFTNGGSQPLGLTKEGTGTLTLSGDSESTGPVTVNGGTLALVAATGFFFSGQPFIGSGSFSNATLLAVSSGTFLNVSSRTDGTLGLNNGQTLKGSGTVTGNLNAQAGSIVNPGDAIGTLNVSGSATLGGTLWLEVSHPTSCDHLTAGGGITYGGTLVVSNTGPALQVGDSFQLFGGATSGFAAVNLETNDFVNLVSYGWSNSIGIDGKVTVTNVATLKNPFPPTLLRSATGNTLHLAWPTNLGWTLLTNSVGLAAPNAWFAYPGSTLVTNVDLTFDKSKANVFFRMVP
jgi:autotransporter-associated beta strand protein